MAVYEWVFSGIGVLALSGAFTLLKKFWNNRKNKSQNRDIVKKQIAILKALEERDRFDDLPDIQYDNIFLYDNSNGLLQIGIVNTGKPGRVTEIKPPFGDWKYCGDSIPTYLRTNASFLMRFHIPRFGSTYKLPNRFKINIKVNDSHNRVYSVALEVTPPGDAKTTDLIQI